MFKQVIMYDAEKIRKELKAQKKSKYYGQWGTDRVIESYFPNGYVGKAIDVGAADGVKGSNTLYFEERGWGVLCIEPNPEYWESLRERRGHVVMCACGAASKIDEMTVFQIGEDKILSSVSSLRPDPRLVDAHKTVIKSSWALWVEVKALNEVLVNFISEPGWIPCEADYARRGRVDFVSIDTEGTELDVLKGFNLNFFDVFLLVIENNYEDPEIEEYLKERGYKKDRRYKINDFYIKDDG